MNHLRIASVASEFEELATSSDTEYQQQLRVLLNVTREIYKVLHLDQLLTTIMDEVRKALNADRCTVFLIDDEKNELWSKTAHGEKEIRFPKNLGVAGYVAMTGEILNIRDAYADPHFNPEIDRKTGYRTRNLLTFPMKNIMGKTIGVFQVLNKLNGHFREIDEEILTTISSIAATQIENAQLYEQQRRLNDELRGMYEQQQKALYSFVQTLASTIDARDPLTAGHSQRIACYCDEVAKILNMDENRREVLHYAALLHDFGKISLRDVILKNHKRFNESQYNEMQKHPAITKKILEKIFLPEKLKDLPQIAGAHHEKMDGTGYPDHLKADQIPLEARILTVVDAFDAMTSNRRYSNRIIDFEKVIHTLENDSGTHFDGYFVTAFKQIPLNRLVEILEDESTDLLETKDLNFLANFTIQDLLNEIAQKSDGESKLIQIFNKYYHRDHLEKKGKDEKNNINS
ncbi:GAF domain-containing protein [candidate division KSB1 bacterium]|nr:GAF domain-containing protein [candidate division KSB1 bacterium]